MAYYSSSFYREEDGYGEYNSYYPLNPSYNNSYSGYYYNDSAPSRDSMAMDSYSSYSSEDSVHFCSSYYDSDVSVPRFPSNIAYSVSATNEPKFVEYYEPVMAPTRFVVSYSVQEFNEPDFEEYDPTPYGGGFDLAETYGKPLPPSDQTCYPRSSSSPIVSSLNEKQEPLKEKEEEEVKKETVPEAEPKTPEGETDQEQGSSQEEEEEERKEKSIENYHPGSGSVTQLPYGYGLEAMDICEGLFGYWPCLSRQRRKLDECQEINYYDYGNQTNNQWNRTADYLFGNPNPYEERNDADGSYSWNGLYSYSQQVESAVNYWYNS